MNHDMAIFTEPTELGLFAGAAGLSLGLELLFGTIRTVAYVERESSAAATLVARMEDEALPKAPVWDDITTFDGKRFAGLVDILSAGFPCQPWSFAGKGKGKEDERWLWDDITQCIRDVRPGVVFLENVPGFVSGGGLDTVLGDLVEAGYSVEWDVFSAREVGASHNRERLFILAYAEDDNWWCQLTKIIKECGWAGLAGSGEDLADTNNTRQHAVCRHGRREVSLEQGNNIEWLCEHVANAMQCDRSAERERQPSECSKELDNCCAGGMANARCQRGQLPSSGEQSAIKRAGCLCNQIPATPPGYDDQEGWQRVLSSNPALEPAVRGMADVMANRVDRLRICGNGVVPLQAAYAFATLAARVIESN